MSALTFNSPLAHAGILAPADLPDLVEKIIPSVVHISVKAQQRPVQMGGWGDVLGLFGIPEDQSPSSLGSGFLIDTEGFVLTNAHVAETSENLLITLHDKRQFNGRVVGLDLKTDIALIQIKEKDGKVPTKLLSSNLGNSDSVRVAQPVVAIGNPFGLSHSVSAGIISSKNRNIGQGPFDNFFQTDAAINPGNSGGPLFDLKGEVIGINSAIYSRTGQFGGIGFAIPINEAKEIIPQLKRYGRVPRPWLGIITRRVTPQLAYAYGLPRADGLVITQMVQGAPADRAGLQPGDIVFQINGKKVEEQVDLERKLYERKPSETVTIDYQRGGKKLMKTISLKELPPKADRIREGLI